MHAQVSLHLLAPVPPQAAQLGDAQVPQQTLHCLASTGSGLRVRVSLTLTLDPPPPGQHGQHHAGTAEARLMQCY
jgi:hypothetical protein